MGDMTLNHIEAEIWPWCAKTAGEGLHKSDVTGSIQRMRPLFQEHDEMWRRKAADRAKSLIQRWKRQGRLVRSGVRGFWVRPDVVDVAQTANDMKESADG
jgi:hypothetical protein